MYKSRITDWRSNGLRNIQPKEGLVCVHELHGALFELCAKKPDGQDVKQQSLRVSTEARIALTHESVASKHCVHLPDVLWFT